MKVLPMLLVSGVALLCGCDEPPPVEVEQQPISDTTPPVVSYLILNRNPNPNVPLAAILSLSTDEPSAVTIRIDDGERDWDATSSDGYAEEHSLNVLGMRPGRVHEISAIVTDMSGNATETRGLEIEMPPLPADMAVPELILSDSDRMEPGVTIFNAFPVDAEGMGVEGFGSVFYIVDDHGEVLWYYRASVDLGDSRRLSNGNLLLGTGFDNLVVEIDMLGNVVQQWHATGTTQEPPEGSTPVAVDSLHHEVSEMPSGNLLALSSELRVIDDFPSSDSDAEAPRGPASVVGDVIVEFTRDGTVVREWGLLDRLDPHRIGYGSLTAGYWTTRYEESEDEPIRDWSHSNALIYDPSDDSYIVSVRHQDAVIKVDRDTGELVWILGSPDNWQEPWSSSLLQPNGELQWQNHEHGPSLTGDGTIVLYDNGNFRAGAYQEQLPLADRYSRAVEYSVDREGMGVEEIWSFGGPESEHFYSSYISDVDWLPTSGNLLITDGGRATDANGANAENVEGTDYWARILEVTHTRPAEKVYELHVKDGGGGRWHVYRAQRLPSLYP